METRNGPDYPAQANVFEQVKGIEIFENFYYKVEFNEWSRVNKGLRQHGLPQVEMAHPASVDKKSDVVMFDSEMSKRMRENYLSLLGDCERRQELIQELIATNNQLREELKAQTLVSERYESRARDLKGMLDSSKSKIVDMEGEIQNTTHTVSAEEEKLRNTNSEVKIRCRQLEKKCRTLEEEMDRLKHKLERMNKEEERRVSKQNQVFQQLKKRSGRTGLDDKVLDIVDSYEKQVYQLTRELEHYRPRDQNETSTENKENMGTPHYKELIRTYEKQLRESKKKQQSLETEMEVVKLELQSRPELADYRAAQSRVKKLERLIKKHDLGHLDDTIDKKTQKKYSTQLDDLEFLPLYHCRGYLKEICHVVGVYDLDHVIPKLQKSMKACEAYPRLEQFAKDVLRVADTCGVVKPPEYMNRTPPGPNNHEVWCERSCSHVIPTLEYWLMQLKSLKELQLSLNKLRHTLMPWQPSRLTDGPPSTTALIQVVDAMVYEEEAESKKEEPRRPSKAKEQSSRAMLQGIIDHFMNLFDVTKVTGCYARMNDVYGKLGETYNVMKSLRDLLGLNKESKSSSVVDAVARVCELQNDSAYNQLKHVLPGEDIQSIVRKVKVHEEFFPVFQEIMKKLLDILEIARIDQVVPTVRSLKLLADR